MHRSREPRRGFWVALTVWLATVATLALLIYRTNEPPRIVRVEPSVAEPGERVVLIGNNFGSTPGRVEIAGKTIPSSAYASWSESKVELTLPHEATSGLIRIIADGRVSKGAFLANRAHLPNVAEPAIVPGRPHIQSIDPQQARIGDVVTIRGRGFRDEQGSGQVAFAWRSETTAGTVDAPPIDGMYRSWTERSIRVVVPDGASTGSVVVRTPDGVSNPVSLEIIATVGTKSYHDRASYALYYGVAIAAEGTPATETPSAAEAAPTGPADNEAPHAAERPTPEAVRGQASSVDADSPATEGVEATPGEGPNDEATPATGPATRRGPDVRIAAATGPGDAPPEVPLRNLLHVWLPEVLPLPEQRNRQVLSAGPSPLAQPVHGYWLYRLRDLAAGEERVVEKSVIFERYAVRTEIVANRVPWDYDTTSPVYIHYTRATDLIPADAEAVVSATTRTVGRERNPHSRARYIYNFVTSSVSNDPGGSTDAVATLETGTGNSLGIAALYVAMARAAGVPSRLSGGFRIGDDLELHPHHWAEFYIETFGWVPVDPVLGSRASVDGEAVEKGYYFGNLDNRRITMTVDEVEHPKLRRDGVVSAVGEDSFWRLTPIERSGELPPNDASVLPALLLGTY